LTSLRQALQASLWGPSLTAQELDRVEAELAERAIPAGGYVCRKGEAVSHWIGVIDGLLKSEPRRYDAVALRDSRVALMPRATFNRLLDTSIGFNRFLLNQLNERLAQFIAMLEYERLAEPEARVARCLSWVFNPFLYPGVGQKLQVSQEELGNLSGISRQRVNQALQALEKEGLLRIEYGGLTILNLEGLRQR
jgi:CRP-like cAMP-binding protein